LGPCIVDRPLCLCNSVLALLSHSARKPGEEDASLAHQPPTHPPPFLSRGPEDDNLGGTRHPSSPHTTQGSHGQGMAVGTKTWMALRAYDRHHLHRDRLAPPRAHLIGTNIVGISETASIRQTGSSSSSRSSRRTTISSSRTRPSSTSRRSRSRPPPHRRSARPSRASPPTSRPRVSPAILSVAAALAYHRSARAAFAHM